MNVLHQIIVVLFLITLELATTDSEKIDKELEAFKKTNTLIVGKVAEPCETACENKNMYCNFEYYKQLSQEAINKLIVDTLIAIEELSIESYTICKDEFLSTSILSTDETKSKESADHPVPFYSEDDTCVYGYIRINSNRDPPCHDSGEEDHHNLCTCRNQSFEFEKTNIVIVSESRQSCDQTCIKKHFTCSFDEYTELSQYEIRHLLKKAALSSVLWKREGMCNSKTGNMFADDVDMNQFDSYPPLMDSVDECIIQGYRRYLFTPMPNCSLNDIYNDDEIDVWFFCSCKIDELASVAPATGTRMIKPTSAENTNSDGDQSNKGIDDTKSDKSLSKLVIAAIVIFVLGLCLIILGVALFLIHRAKKNEKTKKKSIHGDETSKLYPASVRSVTSKGKPGADEVSRTGKSVQITRSSRHGKSDKKLLGLTSKSSVKKTHK